MAYMQADTSPKVGYRPYHSTDAFGAAHLSGVDVKRRQMAGLGTYYLNRPFDPWELYPDVHATAGHGHLHGLGQNHPFKPQAWHLHGVPLDEAIPELTHRVREAAGRGDTFTAQSLVNTLNGLGSLPDPTTIDELENAGYDPLDIKALVEMGASNEQLLALPFPASADEMGAALYALRHSLGGAPGPASVTMYPDVAGAAVRAGTATLGPFGTFVASTGPDAASQAAMASLGPAGALLATAKGTPASVAADTTPPGTRMTAVEAWLSHNAGLVLLGIGGLMLLSDGGGGRRRR